MGKSQQLYIKAKSIIPGGTQLLSKRPELFLPENWPAYYENASGCEVSDLDGNKYIDMCYMGIGACILGYADPDVNKAVKSAIDKGSMCTLNAPEEVELAQLLIELHPWANMVRYTRSGGEAMVVAVRIARAKSKKDTVLFCGYHGWHDWYLASNLADEKSLDGHLLPGLNPYGVPRALKGTSYPFSYNDTEGFLSLVEKHKDTIGVVVLESIRNQYPQTEFLKTIREVTRKLNIILIVDEISAGFRLNAGGAHQILNLQPDIAVFAKGMSNGYPMGAILGKKEIMEVAQDTFISSTYWTERIGPVAALATITKYRENTVHKHLLKVGQGVQEIWKATAQKYELDLHISGIAPLGHFEFNYNEPLLLKTLFTQLMLEKGFLASTAFYASFAHSEEHLEKYKSAVDETFAVIAKSLKTGEPGELLKGPVCHSGFKRLT